MKKLLSVFVLLFSLGSAHAQAKDESVARLVEVDGLVTVTTGNQLVNGVVDSKLLKGSRVVTSSAAGATIEYRSGCRIRLAANESLTVDEDDCCAALFAVVPIAPAVAGAGVLTPALLFGGGAVIIMSSDSKLSGS
jgi:hypothetical protein